MTLFMGTEVAPFHIGRQKNEEIRALFLAAGFKKVTLWRVQCISDVWTCKRSVENYRTFSSVERDDAFLETLGKNYQNVLDKGEALGLEAVIVLCMK
jgi:hypothetical protein